MAAFDDLDEPDDAWTVLPRRRGWYGDEFVGELAPVFTLVWLDKDGNILREDEIDLPIRDAAAWEVTRAALREWTNGMRRRNPDRGPTKNDKPKA